MTQNPCKVSVNAFRVVCPFCAPEGLIALKIVITLTVMTALTLTVIQQTQKLKTLRYRLD